MKNYRIFFKKRLNPSITSVLSFFLLFTFNENAHAKIDSRNIDQSRVIAIVKKAENYIKKTE